MALQSVAAQIEDLRPARSRRINWRAVRRAPLIPFFIVAVIIFCGIFADWIVPHDPVAPDPLLRLQPPAWDGGTWSYPLGTDPVGRDILSRLIKGARVSLEISVTVVLIAGAIGTTFALLSGYFRGVTDMVISRITDAFISMPFLVVAVAVAGIVGASERNLILTLGFLSWSSYARILRGEVLRVAQHDFVMLARITGVPAWRILLRHILPNILNTLVVLATLQLGVTIIASASLDFLGLGIPPPKPAWGSMLAEGRLYMRTAWWVVTVPGVMIALTVMSMNLIGDWMRSTLDPKRRGM